jgi:arylsulfatase A-like enzyme
MDTIPRRKFVAGMGAMGLAGYSRAFSNNTEKPQNQNRPPNVVFIMTDQQRFDALSCAGNPVLSTPNLDRLAREGVRFSQATCSTPLCGPSRASLLSGQYMHAHRCPGNYPIERPGMPEDVTTWEEILHEKGYHCEYHGKWHTGKDNRGCYADGLPNYSKLYHQYLVDKYGEPEKAEGQAIDRYTKWPYEPWEVDRMMIRARQQKRSMPHHNEAGEYPFPCEDSLTAWTAKRAVDYIRTQPKGRFSLSCSILHPHAPLIATKPYSNKYDPAAMPMPQTMVDVFTPERNAIPDVLKLTPDGLGSYISLYYGLVEEVDHWVGEILKALDETGLASNTMVVFTSDHGEMLGDHARVSKMVFYEEALRVPLLIRMPGKIKAGQVLDAPATGADVAPTILDYMGQAVPANMHGRSLRAEIDGKGNAAEFAYGEITNRPKRPNWQRLIRSQEWKFIYKQEQALLYNLAKDPHETKNLLAKEHRSDRWVGKAESLKKELMGIMEETGNPTVDRIRAFGV